LKIRWKVNNTEITSIGTTTRWYSLRSPPTSTLDACQVMDRICSLFMDCYWTISNSLIRNEPIQRRICSCISSNPGRQTRFVDNSRNNCLPQAMGVGRRMILPWSFTGGLRYMKQYYHDAMAIVCICGKPNFFITFTCNPRWPEITQNLAGGTTANDRPDLVVQREIQVG